MFTYCLVRADKPRLHGNKISLERVCVCVCVWLWNVCVCVVVCVCFHGPCSFCLLTQIREPNQSSWDQAMCLWEIFQQVKRRRTGCGRDRYLICVFKTLYQSIYFLATVAPFK